MRLFKAKDRTAEASLMTMTELTPQLAHVGSGRGNEPMTEPPLLRQETIELADSTPPSLGLTLDPSMIGLTLDEVAVVAVADRPVLVPLSPELAHRSGFAVLHVDDETLLALGISPRRVVSAPLTVAPADPTTGKADFFAANDASDSAELTSLAVEPIGVGEPLMVTTPTPAPAPMAGAAPAPAPMSISAQLSTPGHTAAPFAHPLSDAPVETARPINTMAASHRDWEPEALGWPYVDRRADDPAPVAAVTTSPRSLSSGRPVNLAEAAELLIAVHTEPARSVMVDLSSVSVPAIRPLTLRIHRVAPSAGLSATTLPSEKAA